ncbi:hypothetical protein OH809_45125 (plasmid) [Streptomyces sp. NBC_00873]|uniref:hypothetical protein n=1 Tax=Streptomyces sp. NBC_00873 TaxID=2975852 RepID=UPI0037DDD6CB|nr:hypothetical protein OH809_45125 [Streptomyces sp. NBC_00873]
MAEQDLGEDFPPSVQLIAVCHTPGCPVEGQEFVGTYYPYGTYDPPRYMGQCGRCQQPITDLRPVTNPAPDPDPEPPAPVPVEPSPTDTAP